MFNKSFQISFLPLVLAVLFGAIVLSNSALAADKVTFLYGSFYRSVDTTDLEHLVETGEAKGLLESVLELGDLDPEGIRRLLVKKHDLSLRKTSSLVTSPFGRALLRKFGKAISPRRSRQNGDKALSSAVILSIADDDMLQVIEVVRNYPTDMAVDLVELKKLLDDFSGK